MDEYEERIEQGDFENDVDDHEVVPNFEEENMEYHDEGDEMMILASSMIQIRPLATDLLSTQSMQILGKIWLILHVFRYHLFLLGKMGCIFCKGLTFANKKAVKRALIIYAAKDNRNFIIRRSTKTKLCAACVDDNCKRYVGAFMKAKFNGLWMVTSYVGPHSCIPFGLRRDSKMMDSNFVASEIVGKLRQNHTTHIDELWEIIHTKYNHELSYYKVWDAKQKAIAKIFGDWEESYQRL